MKWNWRTEWPQWLLLALMFALAALNWTGAPARIPVHFGLDGQPDRFGGRLQGLLGLPLLAVGLYGLMLFLPRVDPGRANYVSFRPAYDTVRLAVLAIVLASYGVLLANLGHPVTGGPNRLLALGVGVLFVVLGNVMGKLRPNWFVGVRTPWTLSSKLAWNKTNRAAGWVFMANGVGMMAAGALGAGWALPAGLGALVVGSAGLIAYSYFVWRGDPDKTPPAGTLPA